MQTDATTRNIVGQRMLGSARNNMQQGEKTDATYSCFEKSCRKNVHATIPKGNMGYEQYTFPNDCSCRTYFCCFPLALANICPWPLVPFFQISLENREDKTTHNTFRDCRVHFFRQPFSKQLYNIQQCWELLTNNVVFVCTGI